jgi:hypothetical protein
MPLVEDLSPFFADFGEGSTLGGFLVSAIIDTSAIEDTAAGIVTQGPTALITTADATAASAAPGQSFSAGGVSYTVRQVLPEPPDAKLTRLVLARA